MPAYYKGQNKSWYVSFYYKNWQGKNIKKKKEGFTTKREALEYERDFLTRSSKSPDITFNYLIDHYLEDSKSRVRKTTHENKVFLINSKIRPYFAEISISLIDMQTIRTWQNKLLDDKQNYSPTYLKTINNQLNAIFNYALKYWGLSTNPVRICGSIGKKNADSMKFWTKEEFDRFVDGIKDNQTSSLMFQLLFWTGIRVGELLALTLDDFDFTRNSVSINKSFTIYQGEDLIQLPKTPKSKRIIFIHQGLCTSVQQYVENLYDYRTDDRLFPFRKLYLYKEMTRGCATTKVKKIRIHDLRHSHVSLLIELGFSPLVIAERLGHENIQTTLNTYAHLYPNKQEEVSLKLQEICL